MNVSTLLQKRKSQSTFSKTPSKSREYNKLSSSCNLFSSMTIHPKKREREVSKANKPNSNIILLSSGKNTLKKRKSQPFFHRISVNPVSQCNNTSISPQRPNLTADLFKTKKTYLILPGNNTSLIKRCLLNRPNWVESTSGLSCNFLWAPVGTKINYSMHSGNNPANTYVINHFEYYNQLTNKSNLFINLVDYCEKKSLDLFTFIPFTILMQYDHRNYVKQFRSFSYFCSNIEEFLKKDKRKKYTDLYTIDANEKLGHKTLLYMPESLYNGRNLWLIKATNLNRGQCIKVADCIEDVQGTIRNFFKGINRKFTPDDEPNDLKKDEAIVITKQKEKLHQIMKEKSQLIKKGGKETTNAMNNTTNTTKNSFPTNLNKKCYRANKTIIQKYIEKPLLYQGRKFDIRIWVLLTQQMKLYVFKQGHLKATSELFEIKSKNSFVHLTNYSVQKHNENFSLFEYGNEISFEDFQRDLIQQKVNVSVMNDIFPKLCEIIVLSMKAVKAKLNAGERKNCFEVFGYDFMLDYLLNPFLLEVNTNPGLEESSPLINMLVPRMIDDAFRLTIDNIFNDSNIKEWYISPFSVIGYANQENMWKELTEFNE